MVMYTLLHGVCCSNGVGHLSGVCHLIEIRFLNGVCHLKWGLPLNEICCSMFGCPYDMTEKSGLYLACILVSHYMTHKSILICVMDCGPVKDRT